MSGAAPVTDAPGPRVLVSAGDASGELHAAALVGALRARAPGLRCFGLGGAAMEKAGVEIVVRQEELAIGGLVEVARDLGRIVGAWRRMVRALRDGRPDLVVLVDSPDFNIPFARRARRAGVPVLYFIGPQVWAWRRGRMRKVARRVDRMAVIFPFEEPLWREAGVAADFVGHPLVERLPRLCDDRDRAARRRDLGLDPERPLVALLPGSRRNEVRATLPIQLEAALALHARDPSVAFALGLAPSIGPAAVGPAVAAAGLPALLRLDVVAGRTHELLAAADVALVKPGTVTVEAALLGTPGVVTTRVNALTAWLGRRLVRVPSYTMPNLIAGEPVVPEFIQEAARPDAIAGALAGLLSGPERSRQLAGLARVRERLGGDGAASRAAEIALAMMGTSGGTDRT